VIQIDEQIIGNGQPGSITLALLAKYREELARNAEVV
jgi:hypothetical protein